MLHDWIPLENLDENNLSVNPLAIGLIELGQVKANWGNLCNNRNPRAVEYLKKNPALIVWHYLASNPAAIELLRSHTHESYLTRCIFHLRRSIFGFTERDLGSYLFWRELCSNRNPDILSILKNNYHRIDWTILSQNPAAIPLLEKNIHKIVWITLSNNINAIHLLRDNLDRIDWFNLSTNMNAIQLLENNPDKIEPIGLARNHSKGAMRLLKKYIDLDYIEHHIARYNHYYACSCLQPSFAFFLSSNPEAIDILRDNPQYIDYKGLCLNQNVEALDLLEKHLHNISTTHELQIMSRCEYAIPLLQRNPHLIKWEDISLNPGIFIEKNINRYTYTKTTWFDHTCWAEQKIIKEQITDIFCHTSIAPVVSDIISYLYC